MTLNLLGAVGLAMSLSTLVLGQASSEPRSSPERHSGNGISTEEELHKFGITMTHSALRDALNSPNAEVRSLSASALVETKDPEADTLIRSALAKESQPGTRVNMASYLLSIGDQSGVRVLESICQSNDNEGALRLVSAQALMGVHLDSPVCAAGVEELVKTTTHPELRADGIFVLSRYRDLPLADRERIRQLRIDLLSDPDQSVRVRAIESISMSGDVSQVPRLEEMEKEQTDPMERSAISAAIARLRDQQPQ